MKDNGTMLLVYGGRRTHKGKKYIAEKNDQRRGQCTTSNKEAIQDDARTQKDPSSLIDAKTYLTYEEALRQRDFQKVMWMIVNDNIPVEFETKNGESALFAAISAKNVDTVTMLIKSGASINRSNQKGYTPLMKAIAAASPFAELAKDAPIKGRLKLVKNITPIGSNNVSRSDKGVFEQEEDSRFDNRMVECVLKYGPDLLQRDLMGKTAFDWAKRTGNINALRLLEDQQRATTLQHANNSDRHQRVTECLTLIRNHEQYIQHVEQLLSTHLLDEDAFISFLMSTNISAEAYARAVSDLQVCNLEEEVKLLPPFFTNYETRQGWTPLTKASASGHIKVVEILLTMGADLHQETRLRHTAMTWACYCGHEAVCLYLLRVGVNLTQQTREGKTALIHAVSNSQAKIVHHLLLALKELSYPIQPIDTFGNASAEPKIHRQSRRTSLVLEEDSKQLIEWHATFCQFVNWRDQYGNNALHYAECIAAANDERDDSPPATVLNMLQSAIRAAEDHSLYVEKHEERTHMTKCKFNGCDFVAPKDILPVHEHQCVKRQVTCVKCAESIIYKDKEHHDAHSCRMRRVACVNVEFGCREFPLFHEREAHALYHCRKRSMECRLSCGTTVRWDELDHHESTICPLRTVVCDIGCGATFAANTSDRHRNEHCSKRLMSCPGGMKVRSAPVNGCGMILKAEDMQFHLQHLCEKRRFPCKWSVHGCDEWIGGSVASRNHHEMHECPFRLVDCRNNCELSGEILDCFKEEHYRWQCLLEKHPCPNEGCVATNKDKYLPAHLLAVHTLDDAGDCMKRTTRCRLDLCGRYIRLFDAGLVNGDRVIESMTIDTMIAQKQNRLISLKAMRNRLQTYKTFLNEFANTSLTECPKSTKRIPPSDSFNLLQRETTKEFLIQWLRRLQDALEEDVARVEREKDFYAQRCCVLAFDSGKGKHLLEFPDGRSNWISLELCEYDVLLPQDKDCANSIVINPTVLFRCGYMEAEMRAIHEEQDCRLRQVQCPLMCGQKLSAQAVDVHLAKRCNMRNAICRLGCGLIMPYMQLGQHEEESCTLRFIFCEHCHVSIRCQTLTTHLENACPALPRRCRLGCSTFVPWSNTVVHETTECSKRLVQCSACERTIWYSEQEVHARDECPLRLYGECDAGCGEVLQYNQITHHLLYECKHRLVHCSQCDERIRYNSLQEHKAMQCPQRFIYCRKGCGQVLKDLDEEAHEVGECSKRVVYCQNQCGLQLQYCDMGDHLQLSCSMRVIECPNGCKERIFAYQYETHWKRCRQRIVACGTGAKACRRPIRVWFSGKKLVRCAAHQENALLWALKCQDEDLVSYFLQNVDAVTAVNEEFANGFSPLSFAASLGNLDLVKLLHRFGADVNLETSRGRTPLAEACIAQNPVIVEFLIENRASVSHINRHGRALLSMVQSLATAAATVASSAMIEPKSNLIEILRLLEEREALEREQRALFIAIACSDYNHVAQVLKYNSSTSQTRTEGESVDQLELLRDDLHAKENDVKQIRSELKEAICAFNEAIADAEAKSVHVSQLSDQVEDCNSQIQRVENTHEFALADSNALEADMLKLVRQVTAQDIAKMLNTNVPPENYLVVMKSICLMCGVVPRGRRNAAEYTDMEWWKAAQALLMDRTLLQRLRGYRKQIVSADVMAKVRRECFKSPVFSASTMAFQELTMLAEAIDGGSKMESVSRKPTTKLPSAEAFCGDIVGILATWSKGVEIEYKSRADRQVLIERKRKLAITLTATEGSLQQAKFSMEVATRSLPSRQQEVGALRAKVEAAEKELFAAQQRVKTYQLLHFASLSGHTPLTFACAIGNEAMVHMLLAHGACSAYARDELELCASFVQVIIRDYLRRRRIQKQITENPLTTVVNSRSDSAIDALVRDVAHTFLVSHYRRKLCHFRQTHRVPLHEAIFNGFPQIVSVLLANDASLLQKTFVLPERMFPCVLSNVDPQLTNENGNTVHQLGGWQLQPLHRRQRNTSKNNDASTGREPMTVMDTLQLAMEKFNCRTYHVRRGWDPVSMFYDKMEHFLTEILIKQEAEGEQKRKEVTARKNVMRKATAQKALHSALETAIIERSFLRVSELLDEGSFADYETLKGGMSALMAACVEEVYIENADKKDVLVVEFLLDRLTNRPFVDFESSKGHTALSTAARHGTVKCAQALIDRGANVNLTSRHDGRTALMVAAANGQMNFVRLLLQHADLDVFHQDKAQKTALAHAHENGFEEIVHVLGAAMGGNRGRVFSSVSGLYGICKWGCGFMALMEENVVQKSQVIARTRPLEEHERHQCLKRHATCPNNCGIANLWAGELNEHLQKECPLRIVICSQPRCGAQIAFQYRLTHENDECAFRVIQCACGEQMDYQKHVIHSQNSCPMRLVSCPLQCCDEDDQTTPSLLLRFVDVKNHLRNDCPRRKVRCRNGCLANELLARDRLTHEEKICPLRRVQCKWGCDETVIANAQVQHENEECALRQIACPNRCGLMNIVLSELEQHTKALCSHRLTPCPLGCGRKVPLHTIDHHTSTECRKRIVTCSLCHEELIEEDVKTHLTSSCTHRLSVCGLCGQTNILSNRLAQHRTEECRMRQVSCRYNCFVKLLFAHDKERHEAWECPLRPIWCPLGCGETMVANTLKKHEKRCDMRFVTCSNGCGEEMRERDRLVHEISYCTIRKL